MEPQILSSIFYAFVTAPDIATMLSLDQCRCIWLKHETKEQCNFTNLPITSCTLGHNFVTTLLLKHLNVCPSLIIETRIAT